jgi:site-specific recombinase XerD
MTKHPTPQPLFDTLENTLSDIPAEISPPHASRDYQSAFGFLNQYNGNKATFEAYRREVERLLQWSWHIAQKSVLSLKRQDIQDYLQFCLNPPKSWIGLKRVPRFIEKLGERIPNPQWRPFVATVNKIDYKKGISPNKSDYQLSQKSIQEIFTSLSSFYHYLTLEEKVFSNPVALIKQKSKYLQKRQTKATVMRLSQAQWEACIEVAKEMAAEDPLHERTLFILTVLYLLYLRISELAASPRWTPQMGHFYSLSDGSWWFKTVGKGNKMRDIAVSYPMLEALKRYRESHNLSALPTPNETTPLIYKEKGKGALTSTRRIRTLVQLCFDKAVEKLKNKGAAEEANALESATVHWLRHTGISDDINKRGRPVAHVRDDAGHSSSAITDRYNDIELKARHQSAQHKDVVNKPKNKEKKE